jgi:flagellar assembly protein FliH
MSSSSSSRREGAASPYSRFIPREELGRVEAWTPGAFGTGRKAAAEPAPPAEPNAEQWRAQVAAARQAGYEDGYRDGLVALEGFKQSHAAQMSAQLGALVESFEREFDALNAKMADAVARTAVQLARQVLRQELQEHPECIAKVAGEAVDAVLLSARQITVHVHAQDLPLVAAGAQEALRARGARLVASPGVQRGGCRVDSDVGSVDARIATRWAAAAGMLGSQEAWGDDGEVPA